jgi:hypothetical protein
LISGIGRVVAIRLQIIEKSQDNVQGKMLN